MKEEKHSFIYEDPKLGRILMKENDTFHTTLHTIEESEVPFSTIEASWWDLSTINSIMAEKRDELKKQMEKSLFAKTLENISLIKKNVTPLLSKYSSVRAKVLCDELMNEIQLGLTTDDSGKPIEK